MFEVTKTYRVMATGPLCNGDGEVCPQLSYLIHGGSRSYCGLFSMPLALDDDYNKLRCRQCVESEKAQLTKEYNVLGDK